MDRSAFTREVAALALGKRMPDGVYAHVEALPYLPAELQGAVDAARALAGIDGEAFHVVKLARTGWRLSLLAYPGFFDEAFPTLAASWVVDLGARGDGAGLRGGGEPAHPAPQGAAAAAGAPAGGGLRGPTRSGWFWVCAAPSRPTPRRGRRR